MVKGWVKEKTEGFVVVSDTATAMVCMRLVNRNVVVHFWPLLKAKSTSLTSGCTSLSIVHPFLGKAHSFLRKIGTQMIR